MLQSYCIQGFKSIKNATEVDLKKTQYQTLEKTNVCNGILKGCMFVGANASGKTNLIDPLFADGAFCRSRDEMEELFVPVFRCGYV